MQIYDSVLKQKVEFKPIRENEANIYVCGPTVYDDAHLGHAKSSISFDLLRRTLKALGYKVKFVKNFTDIDDKILKKMSESNKSLEDITNHYINRYKADMCALNVLEPSISPKATTSLDDIILYISELVKNGSAYKLDDGIYFDTSKDENYLSLSGRKDENLVARVESSDEKRDPKDFVLWKFDEKWYESPFGKGRPGWHSECVAMIQKHFVGNDEFEIDIHAGGADLLFPHHENEAAQCRCAKHKNLAKYWMHNGFIQVDNEKMSKSLGNSFFIKDALELVPGEALRFYLMSSHYRANFNYNIEDLKSSKKRLDKIYRLKKRLGKIPASNVDDKLKNDLLKFMGDDLNISASLGIIDEMINLANQTLDNEPKNKAFKAVTVANLEFIKELLGIGYADEFEWFQWGVDGEEKERILSLIEQRNKAKKDKNFALADMIRAELANLNVSIMDTANGVMWEKI
ncbi:cysteine--tRNA ligase [Campylobacter hyointestinalis]|uniref:cysteine--tRNA ligase n=1 Tax=Campylobacter hyointestinalis TaxID=198 RepID=UPI0004D9D363|nr:cysteine--tRNA ligase [Campylobacter hyointestinalis]ANE32398.1 cysteinyl-tRNA synthetase [Campylobacter hyointestinalis subsp. hyointestinalis LMG 9260]KEA44341.1 cysteinyl-tRNA synthetase [Campylobacter hyointestinalis subsp. hyointestinalis]PPB71475.1 cysteine--tRNA ligase [Campylobacter hyointestinalis subsp. hyointestinalis]PPB74582.1 cysteine--tRNA ligase [Campylobacter hyointestinalis subsp. hyointestinalis]PPB76231.1 cysteine--tRNA ligase [Campylobacter hyointestinalis subsp. hyoint